MLPNLGQIDIGFDVIRHSAALPQIILPQPLIAVRAAYDPVDIQRLELVDGLDGVFGLVGLGSSGQDDALPHTQCFQPRLDPVLLPLLAGELGQVVKIVHCISISPGPNTASSI